MPGVVGAIRVRSTSSSSGTERVCTRRIASRPFASGGCTTTRRSKRPGRSSAGSSTSGRLVAPSTITSASVSKPSISVRIWLSVCSRSSWPPSHSAAAAAGAPDRVELVDEDDRRRGLLGLLEEVAHARRADADDRLDELRGRRREEGHARLARHGAREQRLAGAGRPGEQHAARDARPELRVLVGVAQEVDHLDQLAPPPPRSRRRPRRSPSATSDSTRLRARAAELARAPRRHRRRRPAARRNRKTNSATSRIVGPKLNRIVSSSERSPGGSALITTSCSSSSCDSSSSFANVGISVSRVLALSSLYLTSLLELALTVSPVEEISFTLPLRTSWRKVGLYGTWMRFSGGAKTATISQFRTNRATRITMKRRGLHGSIGGFSGAPLTRRFAAARVGRRRCGTADPGREPRRPCVNCTYARRNILQGVKQQLRPLFDQVVIKELDPDRVRRSGSAPAAGRARDAAAARDRAGGRPRARLVGRRGHEDARRARRPRGLPWHRRRVGRGRGGASARLPRRHAARRARGAQNLDEGAGAEDDA